MDAPLVHHERLEQATVHRSRTTWSEKSGARHSQDALVVEEPLEIRLGNFPLAVVMRTPGDDLDLVTGFALTEMIVKSPSDLLRVAHCDSEGSGDNVVRIYTQAHISIDVSRFQRNLYSTSSCGICGKRSIKRALEEAPPLDGFSEFSAEMLHAIPQALRARQPLFDATGALHAAALSGPNGVLQLVREDIGRHNAVDKVIGAAAREDINASSYVLVVSGRASYEVIQKALAARIPCVVAVGGVSSLAVSLAERAKMVLVGFARPGGMSIYSGASWVR